MAEKNLDQPSTNAEHSLLEERQRQLDLINRFIIFAKNGMMNFEEVMGYIDKAISNESISTKDVETQRKQLQEVLGLTPEQIRTSKLNLINELIKLASAKSMHPQAVINFINDFVSKNFISAQDAELQIERLNEVISKLNQES